jgi:hypothetical protein
MTDQNEYLDLVEQRLSEFIKRQNKPLFSEYKLIDKNKKYELKCTHCKSDDVIMSDKYVLQGCRKCRKESIPKEVNSMDS